MRTPIIAFMLLVGMTTSVQAGVEVTCFEGIFERATGVPVAETVNFPGIAGPATIRVYNGAEDDEAEKVSSSIISVNGNVVFSSSNFSQGVSYINAEVDLIEGQNSIEILLKSKPGGKIRVEIVQEVEAEGADFVGPQGGIIEVLDSESPLFGTKIEIPEGSAENNSFVTISIATNIQPPNDNLIVSEAIEVNCGSELTGYVLLTCPLNTLINEGDSFLVLHYDDQQHEWASLPISYININDNSVTLATTHFSVFIIQKSKPIDTFPIQSQTNFKLRRDRFNATNDRSTLETYNVCQSGQECTYICSGFAQFSLWYFLNYASCADTTCPMAFT